MDNHGSKPSMKLSKIESCLNENLWCFPFTKKGKITHSVTNEVIAYERVTSFWVYKVMY